METIKVLAVDCQHCAAQVTKALQAVEGIKNIDIKLEDKTALVSFDAGQVSRDEVTAKIEDVGFDVE